MLDCSNVSVQHTLSLSAIHSVVLVAIIMCDLVTMMVNSVGIHACSLVVIN